jgi:hypothetical protein
VRQGVLACVTGVKGVKFGGVLVGVKKVLSLVTCVKGVKGLRASRVSRVLVCFKGVKFASVRQGC